MPPPSHPALVRPVRGRSLRVGFLAVTDAAPLVAAQELGCFSRHGVNVDLRREIGWATVRDKLLFGELDAAVAPAALPWSIELGRGCTPSCRRRRHAARASLPRGLLPASDCSHCPSGDTARGTTYERFKGGRFGRRNCQRHVPPGLDMVHLRRITGRKLVERIAFGLRHQRLADVLPDLFEAMSAPALEITAEMQAIAFDGDEDVVK
jgi:hypothetical protein